jgi:hypothetical protein
MDAVILAVVVVGGRGQGRCALFCFAPTFFTVWPIGSVSFKGGCLVRPFLEAFPIGDVPLYTLASIHNLKELKLVVNDGNY